MSVCLCVHVLVCVSACYSVTPICVCVCVSSSPAAPSFAKVVPFRSSTLTKILRNSFGGNSRTALIVNCSPSSVSGRETLAALRFGDRCV